MAVLPEDKLRKMLADVITVANPIGSAFFSVEEIEDLLESNSNIYGAAAEGWRMRAADVARLVDIMENGSDRKLSQMRRHAEAMALLYDKRAAQLDAEDGIYDNRGIIGVSFEIGEDDEEPDPNWFPYPVFRMPGVLG